MRVIVAGSRSVTDKRVVEAAMDDNYLAPRMNTQTLKGLGAYYTDKLVAGFLVAWALRWPNDRVLDPSCGDGVFLAAACKRLQSLGCKYQPAVFGVDVQEEVISSMSGIPVPSDQLIVSDFFEIGINDIGLVDAVVGNPPFIRYQKFNGRSRAKALKICQQFGVGLSGLSSSWAPFIVYATRFLKPSGRLATIIPAEINHAAYAHPVMQYILDHFRYVRIIAFRERLFPELSQDVFCLLADGYGQECKDLSLVVSDSAQLLDRANLENGARVDIGAIRDGKQRVLQYLLPNTSRRLYDDLAQYKKVRALGSLGRLGTGYVTGANDYFHLSTSEFKRYGIPRSLLRPAVRSGRYIKGLGFTSADWKLQEGANNKVWLLLIPPRQRKLPAQLNEYLKKGERENVHTAYKCKVRKPWYSVPRVYVGDLLLTYMSGVSPRLAVNEAKVVAPNSFHVVRLYDSLSPHLLATSWCTSLAMLSCEIEGHALGGGMLKLEPSEAKRVSIPMLSFIPAEEDVAKIDSMLRAGQLQAALDHADKLVLIQGLGLTRQDCNALRCGYNQLLSWRMR